jgi:hypothetical protein
VHLCTIISMNVLFCILVVICMIVYHLRLFSFSLSIAFLISLLEGLIPSLSVLTMPRKGDKIERFTKFFDKDWKTCRSSLTQLQADDKSYDPSNSWDGRSDNPASFSRLQSTAMPTQTNCPITMSGATVIPLEPFDGLPIFPNYGSKTQSDIPLTVEQRDLGMALNLTGKLTIAENARAEGKNVFLDQTPSFQNMEMRSPRFSTNAVPAFMNEVGPQCDQKLMTPAQRRQVLDFEVRSRAANEYMRKAASDRIKTKKLIAGIPFHRGVLGYDSTKNPESEAYGPRAQALQNKHGKVDRFHDARREYMNKVGGTVVREVLSNTGRGGVDDDKTFQSKGRSNTFDMSFNSTFNTVFGSTKETMNAERAQMLRDQDFSGKTYSITQHTKIEHWPSRPLHRDEDRRLHHPSQASLEMQRNLQGTLLPKSRS